MFAAMSALVVAALAVPESFGARALTFAVAYGVVRIALCRAVSRARPGRHDAPAHGPGVRSEQRGRDRLARRCVVPRSGAADRALGSRDRARLRGCAHRDRRVVAHADALRRTPQPHHHPRARRIDHRVGRGHTRRADATGHLRGRARRRARHRRCGGSTSTSSRSSRSYGWSASRPVASGTALPATPTRTCTCIMVTGIVLTAFGLEHVLEHVHDPLAAEYCFALLGGVAIYLLGHVALRLRSAHTLNVRRLVLAVVLLRRDTARDQDRRARRARGRGRVALGDDRVRDAPVRRVALPVAPRHAARTGCTDRGRPPLTAVRRVADASVERGRHDAERRALIVGAQRGEVRAHVLRVLAGTPAERFDLPQHRQQGVDAEVRRRRRLDAADRTRRPRRRRRHPAPRRSSDCPDAPW